MSASLDQVLQIRDPQLGRRSSPFITDLSGVA